MKQNSIKDIVKNNEERVKQFINESLTTKNGPTTEKILTNCPRCGGPFKVTINLDWSNCYCHKCSTSWTLYNFFKEIGSASSFIELLEELTNLSNYDIFSRIIVSNVHDVTSKQKESGFHKFIKDYGLFPISKLKIPYQYALSRTRNDKQEVSKYYADEKFIYIPITLDGDIKSFLCRSYINLDGSQRYKNISGSISSEYDLINLPAYNAYIKVLIDNYNPPAFSLQTLQRDDNTKNYVNEIKELSRLKYGRSKELVEAEITERSHL